MKYGNVSGVYWLLVGSVCFEIHSLANWTFELYLSRWAFVAAFYKLHLEITWWGNR
jgi:hypothetical protein